MSRSLAIALLLILSATSAHAYAPNLQNSETYNNSAFATIPGAQPTDPDALAAENRALRDELETTRSRVIALEEEVARLLDERQQLQSSLRRAENLLANLRRLITPAEVPDDEPEVAAIPSDPLASPASLLRELRTRYHAHMLGVSHETEADHRAFAERARSWHRTINRELRGRRTWLVRLDDMEPVNGRDPVVRMTVFDPETRLPIGEPFDTAFPVRFMDQFERGTKSELWEVTALVVADPELNVERLEPGVFEFPTLVGPMMEFDFELDWIGLRPHAPATGEAGNDRGQVEDAPDAEPSGDEPPLNDEGPMDDASPLIEDENG